MDLATPTAAVDPAPALDPRERFACPFLGCILSNESCAKRSVRADALRLTVYQPDDDGEMPGNVANHWTPTRWAYLLPCRGCEFGQRRSSILKEYAHSDRPDTLPPLRPRRGHRPTPQPRTAWWRSYPHGEPTENFGEVAARRAASDDEIELAAIDAYPGRWHNPEAGLIRANEHAFFAAVLRYRIASDDDTALDHEAQVRADQQSMVGRCRRIKKNGETCQNRAHRDGYCGVHCGHYSQAPVPDPARIYLTVPRGMGMFVYRRRLKQTVPTGLCEAWLGRCLGLCGAPAEPVRTGRFSTDGEVVLNLCDGHAKALADVRHTKTLQRRVEAFAMREAQALAKRKPLGAARPTPARAPSPPVQTDPWSGWSIVDMRALWQSMQQPVVLRAPTLPQEALLDRLRELREIDERLARLAQEVAAPVPVSPSSPSPRSYSPEEP